MFLTLQKQHNCSRHIPQRPSPSPSRTTITPLPSYVYSENTSLKSFSSKGVNPSYANAQGIEPAFDISHERIKGEHNREQKRKQSSRQKTTTWPAMETSTAASDKRIVASILFIILYSDLVRKAFSRRNTLAPLIRYVFPQNANVVERQLPMASYTGTRYTVSYRVRAYVCLYCTIRAPSEPLQISAMHKLNRV